MYYLLTMIDLNEASMKKRDRWDEYRIKDKGKNVKESKRDCCGSQIFLANQKRKHRGARDKEFFFLRVVVQRSSYQSRYPYYILSSLYFCLLPALPFPILAARKVAWNFRDSSNLYTTWLNLAWFQTCSSGLILFLAFKHKRQE